MKRKEIMTISEFLNMTRESELERFLNNKKFKSVVIVGVAIGLCLINTKVTGAATNTALNTDSIDKLGNTFLSLVRKSGYWICLVMGIVNCVKVGLQGGDKAGDIAKVIFKYVLVFASLYLLPFLFDLVEASFK